MTPVIWPVPVAEFKLNDTQGKKPEADTVSVGDVIAGVPDQVDHDPGCADASGALSISPEYAVTPVDHVYTVQVVHEPPEGDDDPQRLSRTVRDAELNAVPDAGLVTVEAVTV